MNLKIEISRASGSGWCWRVRDSGIRYGEKFLAVGSCGDEETARRRANDVVINVSKLWD